MSDCARRIEIEQHLMLAFEEAFRVGEKPVTAEVVEAVLSRHMDDLEPRLVRNGYDVRGRRRACWAPSPAEVRQLLQEHLGRRPGPARSAIR